MSSNISSGWKTGFIPDVRYPLVALDRRCWRMLRVKWQHAPLSGAGAERLGGRWNRIGLPALYLALDHPTAIAEFHQRMTIPGTLVAYDLSATQIADLTDGAGGAASAEVAAALAENWITVARIDGGEPTGWTLADRLIAQDVDGALVPSVQNNGGTNLVLWRWSADGAAGAKLVLIDPDRDLDRRS